MKIAILSENPIIKEALEQIDEVKKVENVHEIEDIGMNFNTLILDKGELASVDLIELRERFPNFKIMLLVKIGEDTFFEKACTTHSIDVVSKDIIEKEIVYFVKTNWLGKDLGSNSDYQNVYAVMGTHNQVGSSEFCFGVAKVLSEYNRRVVVVGLNPYNPSEIRTVNTNQSLDQIYPLLENKVLKQSDDIKKYLTGVEGFDYLIGNRDFYNAVNYTEEPIHYMIDILKDEYDFVLLDIGSFYDNLLPLTGLSIADTHIVISSQEIASIQQYKRWNEQILKRVNFKPNNRFLIVNKYSSRAVITPKQLQVELEIPLLGNLPFVSEANDDVYNDGFIANGNHKGYYTSIINITKALMNIADKDNSSKKPFFLTKIFRKEG
ncbi:hypothetical protein BKP35_16515 [Anaerobacillus arseniciselenatis]|uniref:AAA domain-containing protein n=1 Tax=Anaerobacillus arseniciselenatis TaxID=85682 RepID=A0A1S2LCK5_9BACI|nr:hypothetical protein [Anaerobacillus arseniciselenatis]OIJ09457.1 hypothetical protein BKP35_16515 [Anaerobacillus arseniciselenatis]